MTIIQLHKKRKFSLLHGWYDVTEDISIPTEWNDLTGEQLLQVIATMENKDYTPDQVIVKLFKIIAGLSYRRFFKLKPEHIEEFIYLVNFLFDDARLTKQLLPVYERLYGPSDEMANLVMGEFVFSEHYYTEWEKDKTNTSMLNNFVATIYRPAKRKYDFERDPDGDCRLPFNENIAAYYAVHLISDWPMNVKLAIATWYACCREKLVADNEDVFGGGGEAAKYGLISVIRVIAKEGVHGKFEDIEKKQVNLLMIELNEVVAEGKRMEKQNQS